MKRSLALVKNKARLDTEISNLSKRYLELRGTQKAVEEEINEIKERYAAIMQDLKADCLSVDGFNVVRSEQSREVAKVKDLRAAFGSVVEKFISVTNYSVYRVTEQTVTARQETDKAA